MSSRRAGATAAGFLAPFCVLFCAVFLVPIGYAIYQSLFKVVHTGPLGLVGTRQVFTGLGNYARALGSSQFDGSLERVLLFALVIVPLMVLLATVLALLLDTASAYGVPFFRAAFFLPYGVPGVIAAILWGFLYVPGISPIVDLLGDLGVHANLLGSGTVFWSITNIVLWEFAGYNMLVLVAQLKAIPADLYEAARIDGAGAWQAVWHVKLPMIRPALVLTAVFTIIGTLQIFAEPLLLQPLSTSISNDYTPNLSAYNAAFTTNDYHLAAAEAVLLALVACVLSFGFLRLVGRRAGR